MSEWKIGHRTRKWTTSTYSIPLAVEMDDEPGKPLRVLVDGDIIAYRCAAATEGTYYTYEPTGRKFKYHKEAIKYSAARLEMSVKEGLKASEIRKLAAADLTKHAEPEPVENAYHNMKQIFRKITNHYSKWEPEYKVYLTSPTLFRDEISDSYKASREGLKRPTHLKACKDWLKEVYGAVEVEQYEADDLIAMEWYRKDDAECVIVSLDKDLMQLAGRHYDFVKDMETSVSGSKARRNFWTQVLIGDPVDDIIGLKGVGPKTAELLTQDLYAVDANDREYYDMVLMQYMEISEKEKGESKKDFMTRMIRQVGKNCRLLYLVREPGKFWDVPDEEPKKERA